VTDSAVHGALDEVKSNR